MITCYNWDPYKLKDFQEQINSLAKRLADSKRQNPKQPSKQREDFLAKLMQEATPKMPKIKKQKTPLTNSKSKSNQTDIEFLGIEKILTMPLAAQLGLLLMLDNEYKKGSGTRKNDFDHTINYYKNEHSNEQGRFDHQEQPNVVMNNDDYLRHVVEEASTTSSLPDSKRRKGEGVPKDEQNVRSPVEASTHVQTLINFSKMHHDVSSIFYYDPILNRMIMASGINAKNANTTAFINVCEFGSERWLRIRCQLKAKNIIKKLRSGFLKSSKNYNLQQRKIKGNNQNCIRPYNLLNN